MHEARFSQDQSGGGPSPQPIVKETKSNPPEIQKRIQEQTAA
jgi:hypothetical protein